MVVPFFLFHFPRRRTNVDPIIAAFGFAGPADDEPNEPPVTPPQNPWLGTPGQNGCLEYSSEDAEERELTRALEPLEKLFSPPAQQSSQPIEWHPLPFEDPFMDPEDREALNAIRPITKLFYPTAAQVTATLKSQTDPEWDEPIDAPLAKRSKIVRYETERSADGLLFRKGFDVGGELLSYLLVLDESE
jgi:hypothetical protein